MLEEFPGICPLPDGAQFSDRTPLARHCYNRSPHDGVEDLSALVAEVSDTHARHLRIVSRVIPSRHGKPENAGRQT